MSKNSRVALAVAGVVILIAAAVLIGTKDDDNSTATPATPEVTAPSGATPDTGGSGATGNESEVSPGSETDEDSGSGTGSGGTKPDDDSNTGTGGATASGKKPKGFAAAPLITPNSDIKITVDKGDVVYLRAKSPVDDELHIHGYDKSVDLPAEQEVRYKFTAKNDGVFEIELHHSGGQVATLKVNP